MQTEGESSREGEIRFEDGGTMSASSPRATLMVRPGTPGLSRSDITMILFRAPFQPEARIVVIPKAIIVKTQSGFQLQHSGGVSNLSAYDAACLILRHHKQAELVAALGSCKTI